jgi:hypothetical protein
LRYEVDVEGDIVYGGVGRGHGRRCGRGQSATVHRWMVRFIPALSAKLGSEEIVVIVLLLLLRILWIHGTRSRRRREMEVRKIKESWGEWVNERPARTRDETLPLHFHPSQI